MPNLYNENLGAPGTTGWVLPTSARLSGWDISSGVSVLGPSTASHRTPNQYYTPYNAGIIQDISSYPTELNASTKCFVSAGLGDLLVDASATYNVTLTDNQTLTQVSLAYDNIFDYSLSNTDSLKFLNAFEVNGIKLSLPEGKEDQAAAGATCTFDISAFGVADLLKTVLLNATDASGDVASRFLADTLNAVLVQIEQVGFGNAYESLANGITDASGGPYINLNDIALGVDVSSSVVTINTTSSVATIGSKCYDGTNAQALVNQIDVAHINAYKSNTTDTMSITSFPGLPGDQFVFGLKSDAPQVRFLFNKATSSAPNDLASLDLNWLEFQTDATGSQSVRDNNWVLAFRITVTRDANSGPGVATIVNDTPYTALKAAPAPV